MNRVIDVVCNGANSSYLFVILVRQDVKGPLKPNLLWKDWDQTVYLCRNKPRENGDSFALPDGLKLS